MGRAGRRTGGQARWHRSGSQVVPNHAQLACPNIGRVAAEKRAGPKRKGKGWWWWWWWEWGWWRGGGLESPQDGRPPDDPGCSARREFVKPGSLQALSLTKLTNQPNHRTAKPSQPTGRSRRSRRTGAGQADPVWLVARGRSRHRRPGCRAEQRGGLARGRPFFSSSPATGPGKCGPDEARGAAARGRRAAGGPPVGTK